MKQEEKHQNKTPEKIRLEKVRFEISASKRERKNK